MWPSIISTIYNEQHNLRIPTFKTIITYLLIIFSVHIINIIYHIHRKYDKKYPPMAPGGMFNHIFRATKSNYAWWLLVRLLCYVMCLICKRLCLLEWEFICLIQTNTFSILTISISLITIHTFRNNQDNFQMGYIKSQCPSRQQHISS